MEMKLHGEADVPINQGSENTIVKDFQLLFVGDHNLGPDGTLVLEKHGLKPTSLFWQKGDKEGKKECRDIIRSQKWDFAMLFYCDLILKSEDLAQIRYTGNIHPAGPGYRDVGYDVVPLLHGRNHHSNTFHWVTDEEVDAGPIINILRRPMPKTANYRWLRRSNQELSLEHLDWVAKTLVEAESIETFKRDLDAMAKALGRSWSPERYHQDRVDQMLYEMWRTNPSHGVFEGNEKFRGWLDKLEEDLKKQAKK
jgi:methionyl-tRNA formyltransferase